MQTAEALFSAEGLRLLTGHGYDTVARGFQIGYLPSAMPRSAIFEIWYELGIIGAASLAAVVFLAFHATAQLPKPLTGFLQGALVCGSVIGLSGLVTAQIWWITILSVVGILFALVAKGQYRTERPSAKNISANALRPQI
jgi:CHASE2 domain-containing sensor protein